MNELESGQTVWFRVTGTKRSVDQIVVFEGNLLAHTNASAQAAYSFRSATSQPSVGGDASDLFSNSRIQGRARIGANEIEIDAAPAK